MELGGGGDGGETIEWPKGFKCLSRKEGSGAHGETWVVEDNVPEAISALEETVKKLGAAIRVTSKQIEKLKDTLEEQNEEAEAAEEELAEFRTAALQRKGSDSIDPYGLEGGDDETASRLELYNPSNLEAAIEHQNQHKNDLEGLLLDSEKQIESLRKMQFKVGWNQTALPAQLIRMDAPWLQQSVAASTTAVAPSPKKKVKATSSKSSTSQRGVEGEDTVTGEEKTKNKYCFKLLSVGIAEVGDGRRMFSSDSTGDKEVLRSLISDGQSLLRYQWRAIISSGVGGEECGILPLVAVLDVTRKHKKFNEVYNAAFVSPLCENGSVASVIKTIAGRKSAFWFEDKLILRNLKATIQSLANLQQNGVSHGNIKPSNLYVSDDGFRLILGDFLPKTEFIRWAQDLRKGLTAVPNFTSPELYNEIVVKKVNIEKFKEKLFKHDVFCLGLLYLYITTRTEPITAYKSPQLLAKALTFLEKTPHDQELIDLLKKMLTYDHESRPSFWDLLTLFGQLSMIGQNALSLAKEFLGLEDKTDSRTQAATETTRRSSLTKEEKNQGCTTQ